MNLTISRAAEPGLRAALENCQVPLGEEAVLPLLAHHDLQAVAHGVGGRRRIAGPENRVGVAGHHVLGETGQNLSHDRGAVGAQGEDLVEGRRGIAIAGTLGSSGISV